MKLNSNFFNKVKANLFNGSLTQQQVDGLNSIFNAWEKVDGKSIDLLAFSLAITYHEVGQKMIPVKENLNYTTAAQIKKVWPTRFPTIADAQLYVKNPQKLANKVYTGRMGNNAPNDGYLYLGRGYSQITGKENYTKFGKLLKLDLVNNPDLVLQPEIGAQILILGIRDGLFTGKKLSDYTSFNKARATVNPDSTRKAANGLTIGQNVENYTNKFKEALSNGIDKTTSVVVPKPDTPVNEPPVVTPNPPASNKPTTLADILSKILNAILSVFRRK